MLKKVISGGQTGVDIAALRAARTCGLATGGSVPAGCRTLNGPNPDLIKVYGCVEHVSPLYPPRTWRNVDDSDGTLRIARNFSSPGELCTWKAIVSLRKPNLSITMSGGWTGTAEDRYVEFVPALDWIENHEIEILNVAGNSEKTCPGIEKSAENFLIELFKLCMK